MIGKDIIKEKVNYFFNQQCKVHIIKVPNAKFPKGKFYNGIIGQVYSDKILFDDDKEGMLEIFFIEIADIDKFREEKSGE